VSPVSRSWRSLTGPLAGPLAALLLLAIALAWLHPQIVFDGQIYTSADARTAAAVQSLGNDTDGEIPHWNPFVFCGMPSWASLAHNPGAYPLTTPLRVLRDGLGLPPMFWLLFHLGLAGLGTAGWLRWRGESWPVAIAAACWVVALPKLAAWGAYGHGTKLGGFAWVPLVGWCTEALLRRGGPAWASGLALALGMMLLRGHVQIAWYAVLMVAIFVTAAWVAAWVGSGRDAAGRRWLLRQTGWIALAGIVALSVSLALYLPVLEYQAHSIRGSASTGGGTAFDYATNWSLSWPEFATMWWPTVAGYGRGAYVGQMPFTDYPNYIGLPLIILALAGVVVRRDRMSWTLVALVVLATLIALGKNFFVYRIFYELAPGFRKFRVPVMILALQQLALIILAARGLGALFTDRKRIEVPRPLLIIIAAVGLLGVILGTLGGGLLRDSTLEGLASMARGFGRPVPPPAALAEAAALATADALRLGAILLAGSLLVFAAQLRRIPATAGLVLLGLLVFVDLWRVDQPLLRPEHSLSRVGRTASGLVVVPSPTMLADAASLAEYTGDNAMARWLKQQTPRPRVLPLGGLESDNQLAGHQIVSLGGYHAAKLKLYEDVRKRIFDPTAPRLKLARMFGAQWLVSPRPLGDSTLDALGRLGLPVVREPVYSGPDGAAYEILDPMPRAWVVGAIEPEQPGQDTTVQEPEVAVLDRVLAQGFDPARTAILSAVPDPLPQTGSAASSVEVAEEGYNYWSLQVELPQAGVLVTADPWYPAWKVLVDGQPARLLRANYAQRAVALTAGSHRVEFLYDARAYTRGKRLATVGWILIAAGFIGPWPYRRLKDRREPQGPPSGPQPGPGNEPGKEPVRT